MAAVENAPTPLMQQYHDIKREYSDVLLMFQVGDFYELFFDDAKQAAAALGIALTARGKNKGDPIPLCGVPVHARDYYVVKLVKSGFKIAICDQLEQPKPGSVVRRGVTRVLTPGMLTDTTLLDDKSASYLFSIVPGEDGVGLLCAELLTAQLFATVIPAHNVRSLESELARFFPDEIIIPSTTAGKSVQQLCKQLGYYVTTVAAIDSDDQIHTQLNQWMTRQFKESSTTIVARHESIKIALTYFYAYVHKTHCDALNQFNHLQFYQPEDFLMLDAATQRNLDLVKNNRDGSTKHTLLEVLDKASTAMGSRMIKKWLQRPLVNQEAITQRLDVVEMAVNDVQLLHRVQAALAQMGDLERTIGRIALQRASYHDYVALARGLSLVPVIQQAFASHALPPLLAIILQHMGDFSLLTQLLQAAFNDDATKDWIIKKGFDVQLDEMRDLAEHGHQKIVELERSEQEKTGISSLKIRYNQIHGYAIEITKTHLDAIPSHYIRLQTLVGRERFIMPELQQLQDNIVRAQAEVGQIEKRLFEQIRIQVATYVTPLRKLTHALAHLDALLSLATVAYNNNYTRPQFNADRLISIKAGRHPIIEQTLSSCFIPNDMQLSDDTSLWIITGPNMGGKSTFLRQNALISILAQCGSFVPAQSANLSILDRVFTRIGAGDSLAEGKSTFLVEMEETAAICTQATSRSLVILDEVGRGTSTFDGLALAQSIIEYIYHSVGARCLFATHYHELTHLHDQYAGIVNYYAASKRTAQGILFLYTMIPGVADGSFGLEVARLAELPASIIARAQQVLAELPHTHISSQATHVSTEQSIPEEYQRVVDAISSIDIENMTPRLALDFLWQLKSILS